MNKVLILLTVVLISSCNQNKKENFDWLLGKWKRTNEELGKETFENWQKKSDTEYIGLGFTIQNGDTIMQEKIKLIKSNNNWNLEVKVSEESESIIFKMTNYGGKKFTCENKEIDFPKKIKYWKNGDKINASVSVDEMEILFEFERLK